MVERNHLQRVALQVTHRCLIATIQIELDDATLAQFQKDLLSAVHQSDVTAVILDLSTVKIMDSYEFSNSSHRGYGHVDGPESHTSIVGLQSGVVSALVDMDLALEGLLTALNLEDALRLLDADSQQEEELSEEPDVTEEANAESGDTNLDDE